MVSALVTPAHTVIEMGARFGTTSCMLAAMTNNSGRVISVEPEDGQVLAHLLDNREAHCCAFHIVSGTVSTRPLTIRRAAGSKSYSQQTQLAGAGRTAGEMAIGDGGSSQGETTLPNLDLGTLEAATGSRINAALVDCEGCIDAVLGPGEEVSPLLAQLELLMVEEDQPSRANYSHWHAKLRRLGFRNIWCAREVPVSASDLWGGTRQVHSGWLRGTSVSPSVGYPRLGGGGAAGACEHALRALRLPPTVQPPIECVPNACW